MKLKMEEFQDYLKGEVEATYIQGMRFWKIPTDCTGVIDLFVFETFFYSWVSCLSPRKSFQIQEIMK